MLAVRLTNVLKRLRTYWFYIFGCTLIALQFAPIFTTYWGHYKLDSDWDQHLTFSWIPIFIIKKWGQIPLWNPFMCGGTSLIGNPEIRFPTPFNILYLGDFWSAVQIDIFLHSLLAMCGGIFLGRTLQFRALPSLLCGVVFALSSWFWIKMAEGHSLIYSWCYFPLLFACFVKQMHLPTFGNIAATSVLLAMLVYEGGIYPAPHAALFLGTLTLYYAITSYQLRPILTMAISGLLAFGLSAFRLFPFFGLMRTSPRLIDSDEAIPLEWIPKLLFSSEQLHGGPSPGPWGYHEFGAYIGIAVFCLALLAGFYKPRCKIYPWLLLVIVAGMLGIGSAPGSIIEKLMPWPYLHQIPIFASQHVPSRFLVTFVLGMAVLAGFGANFLIEKKPWLGNIIVIFALTSFCVTAFHNNYLNIGLTFAKKMPKPFLIDQEFSMTNADQMLPAIMTNKGVLNCYQNMRGPINAVEGKLLLNNEAKILFEPNRLGLSDLPLGEKVQINMNFDSGWYSSDPDTLVIDMDGRLGVIAKNAKEAHLQYRPVDAAFGALVTFLSGLFLVFGYFCRHRFF